MNRVLRKVAHQLQLLELFWSFFQIGLFSIGGGYAALPLIETQIVDLHGWLTHLQFQDIITIAEMTPGPIAINASTFVGTKIAGISGALIATFGCVLPSCIIVIALAKIYYKYRNLDSIQYVLSGLRPAVVGMIASAGVGIILLAFFTDGLMPKTIADVHFVSLILFALGLFAARKFNLSPITIIVASGVLGLIIYAIIGNAPLPNKEVQTPPAIVETASPKTLEEPTAGLVEPTLVPTE